MEAPHVPPEEEVPGVGRVVVRLGVGQVVALLAVGGVGELEARHVARLHEGIHRGHPGTGGYWAGRGDISTHHHLSHHSSPLPPLRPPETSRSQLLHSLQFSLSQLRFVLVRPAFFWSSDGCKTRPESSMLISHNKITNIPTLIGPRMTLLSSNWSRYLVRYLAHLLNIQDLIQNSNYKTADSSVRILSNCGSWLGCRCENWRCEHSLSHIYTSSQHNINDGPPSPSCPAFTSHSIYLV